MQRGLGVVLRKVISLPHSLPHHPPPARAPASPQIPSPSIQPFPHPTSSPAPRLSLPPPAPPSAIVLPVCPRACSRGKKGGLEPNYLVSSLHPYGINFHMRGKIIRWEFIRASNGGSPPPLPRRRPPPSFSKHKLMLCRQRTVHPKKNTRYLMFPN